MNKCVLRVLMLVYALSITTYTSMSYSSVVIDDKVETKKFSIIIPIYNTERYLVECIDSAINQSYRNIEIILVNDGSPGNADEICKRYQQLDNRIKYLKQSNQGVAIARNHGIAMSSGDYVFCLDSDDTIEHDFISKIAQTFQKASSDLVIVGKRFSLEPLYVMGAMPTCAIAVTKKLLNKYPNIRFQEHMQPCEDGLFSHKLMTLAKNIAYCSNTKYFYRQHMESNSHKISTQQLLRDIPKWLNILENFYANYNLWDTKKSYFLGFIRNEPYFRFNEMSFSIFEQQYLFNLIHKYINKYNLNNIEEIECFPTDFKYFVRSDSYLGYAIKSFFYRVKIAWQVYVEGRSPSSIIYN